VRAEVDRKTGPPKLTRGRAPPLGCGRRSQNPERPGVTTPPCPCVDQARNISEREVDLR
jgi:hypothetical protein